MKHITPLRLSARNGHIIRSLAAEAEPYQMIRELVQNSIEAGATEVYITTECLYANHTAALGKRVDKLTFVDNGCGMSAPELRKYMQGFGESNKEVGRDRNFGTGAKTLSLDASPLGVDILTYQNGVAHMVRLCADEKGDYGLYSFEGVNDTILDEEAMGSCPEILPGLADMYRREHGTVVIIWGKDLNEDTFRFRGKSPRNMLKYLQGRYFTRPGKVKIQVYDPPAGLDPIKKDWITSPDYDKSRTSTVSQDRTVQGATYFLDQYSATKGKIRVTDGTWHWWAFGDDAKGSLSGASKEDENAHKSLKAGSSNGCGHGFTGILYQGEIYENSRDHNRAAQCGLFSVASRKRVTLIFEPDAHLVYPNQVRSRLLDATQTNDKDVYAPWGKWALEFRANTPPEIQKVISDEAPPIDMDQIQQRLDDHLAAMAEFIEMEHHRQGHTKTRTPNKTSGTHGKTGTGTPKRRRFPKLVPMDLPNPPRPVEYDPETHEIRCFLHHPRLLRYKEELHRTFGDAPGIDAVVEKAVLMVVGQETGQRILVARTAKLKAEYRNQDEYDRLTSPEALDAVVSGFLTLYRQMRQYVAGVTNIKVTKPTAATA